MTGNVDWFVKFIEMKAGEVQVIPALMKKIDIRGMVVTADAGACYPRIANTIVEEGGDYCFVSIIN